MDSKKKPHEPRVTEYKKAPLVGHKKSRAIYPRPGHHVKVLPWGHRTVKVGPRNTVLDNADSIRYPGLALFNLKQGRAFRKGPADRIFIEEIIAWEKINPREKGPVQCGRVKNNI